jgi:hypothetical protein
MKRFLKIKRENSLERLTFTIALFLCPAGYSELFGFVMNKFSLSYNGTRYVFYLLFGLFFLFYTMLVIKRKIKENKKRDI